jgi:hypothetical protein
MPLQRVAGTVLVLILSALLAFWTVKNTRPSGNAVFPILYGVLIASALVWLLAGWLRRRKVTIASTQKTVDEGGGTIVEQSVISHDQSGGISSHSDDWITRSEGVQRPPMTDDARHIHVTSHGQSGGITAGTVNIGAQPEIRHETLCVNAEDGDRYACQARLILVGARAGVSLRVEVIDQSPIDLELMAENAPIVMVARKFAESPEHKIIEMAPPLAASYIATIRADKKIGNANLKFRFTSPVRQRQDDSC